MQVRDGMSEVVLTVGPTHTLREAAAMMAEKRIGAALVSDDETPVARILTELRQDVDAVVHSAGLGQADLHVLPSSSRRRSASRQAAFSGGRSRSINSQMRTTSMLW